MASLKEVKGRISSVMSTQQITKAMKMVAAAKLKRATDNIIQMRPYAQKLNAILQNVTAGMEGSVDNQFAQEREVSKVLIVLLTSDKGLCGAFNGNVIKATRQLLVGKYAAQHQAGNVTLMPIGRKAADFVRKGGYKTVNEYSDLFTRLNFNAVREAAEFAMAGFAKGDFDRVEIVYNEFKNVATQILKTDQFLPIMPTVSEVSEASSDYIFEPSKEYIVQELIPTSLKVQFYKSLLESNASEHGARMTAMDKATENAGELLKELRLTYNRTRQAAITKEILEIVAGAEALSGK
ncbi:ATP synthase F1 subunit gamma [Cytophagales bacterium LB-30]|uniref:ATP synthase gamma chain n=1 Tax=Shiella aurantiaca TaxID=3058365 RepID=A0ABT8F6Q8_9BACT|nr:ATP synthase F1 subunit gamma [Shiella aurantiaca]MDN4166135.1 ATP synthase F1 subunit gamma [Shiella aurantiaca]